MKKLLPILIVLLLLCNSLLFSQVGVNTDGSLPDNSAILDAKSTTRGFLPPRMTHAELDAIVSPADGLVVFCTDCGSNGPGALSLYMGGTWYTLSSNCLVPLSPLTSTHNATLNQIVWNWNTVVSATGYKWNTINDYNTASELDTATTHTETGLACNTLYTRYAWAYSACGNSTPVTMNMTTLVNPEAPVSGTHVPSLTQIIWNWNAVPEAVGYKWSTINDYNTATDMATATTQTETGLTCNTTYTRYAWAYSTCGNSTPVILAETTLITPPVPASGTHVPSLTEIVWNWNTVSEATGYKWNTTDDYNTAIDLGILTTETETGLTCNTSYTRYAWAYSACGNSTPVTLSQATSPNPPAVPVSGTHVPALTEIIWNWETVPDATGYKWNTTNDYNTATDMGMDLTKTETVLTCNTAYTRYVWAYGACGNSTSVTLSESTLPDPPAATTSGTHVATELKIVWNWTAVPGATGYKWNTTNDYATATNMGTAITKTETGLTCNTVYTRYAWAYSACGNSTSVELTASTGACFVCGTSITVVHVAGNVSPVAKTVTYGTVTSIPGAASKCWITRNLGASQQALAYNDNTEASGGWYWQFNRKQGYQLLTTSNRIPNTTWVSLISENLEWQTANDPCALLLGDGWRVPTATEWINVDAAGNWVDPQGPWTSGLKMHQAGRLSSGTGSLQNRGNNGTYWGSTQMVGQTGMAEFMSFLGTVCQMANSAKAMGASVRCVKD